MCHYEPTRNKAWMSKDGNVPNSSVYRSPSSLFARPKCAAAKKSQAGCLWMRGVREGWFKECKIDTVKVMSGACGNSRVWKVIKSLWGV